MTSQKPCEDVARGWCVWPLCVQARRRTSGWQWTRSVGWRFKPWPWTVLRRPALPPPRTSFTWDVQVCLFGCVLHGCVYWMHYRPPSCSVTLSQTLYVSFCTYAFSSVYPSFVHENWGVFLVWIDSKPEFIFSQTCSTLCGIVACSGHSAVSFSISVLTKCILYVDISFVCWFLSSSESRCDHFIGWHCGSWDRPSSSKTFKTDDVCDLADLLRWKPVLDTSFYIIYIYIYIYIYIDKLAKEKTSRLGETPNFRLAPSSRALIWPGTVWQGLYIFRTLILPYCYCLSWLRKVKNYNLYCLAIFFLNKDMTFCFFLTEYSIVMFDSHTGQKRWEFKCLSWCCCCNLWSLMWYEPVL